MTDPMAVAAASVIVIGAMSTATVAIVSAIGRVKKEMLAGQVRVEQKAEIIHGLVNGSSKAAEAKLASLEEQVAQLYSELKHLQELRVEDAQAKAKK